jgi:hypothetical protein
VQFFSTSVDNVEQTVSMDIAGYMAATFQICARLQGLADTPVARVGFIAPDCAFAMVEPNPCTARSCIDDPSSDECAAFTAEYCSENLDDSGCALVIPQFRREVGASIVVLHAEKRGAVTVTRLECECGGTCGATGIAVTGTPTGIKLGGNSAGTLVLNFDATEVGVYRICTGDVTVGSIDIIPAACNFDATAETPCTATVCTDPVRAQDPEACQLYTAEYCTEHPEDTGCLFLALQFERPAFSATTLVVRAPLATVPAEVELVPTECACNAEVCAAADTHLRKVEIEDGVMTLLIEPLSLAPVQLCVRGEVFARIHPAASCAFQLNGDASPCLLSVCATDPESEACQQFVADMCADNPKDPGCALLAPAFAREVSDSTATIEFSTNAIAGTEFVFIDAACRCGDTSACGAAPLQTVRSTVLEGVVEVDFVPTAVGEFRLCASGVQEAFVTVMQATCAFDYIDTGLSPCSADPCVG